MTILAILAGVLGGAGVIAAFVRTRRSRSAGRLGLGLGALFPKPTRQERGR